MTIIYKCQFYDGQKHDALVLISELYFTNPSHARQTLLSTYSQVATEFKWDTVRGHGWVFKGEEEIAKLVVTPLEVLERETHL